MTVFAEHETDRATTSELIDYISKFEEWPWAGWNRGKVVTPGQIAKLLNLFSIVSTTIRIGTETPKGYKKKSFEEAFSRYLPDFSAIPPHSSIDAGKRDFLSATPENNVAKKNDGKSSSYAGCGGVADKKGGRRRKWAAS